MQFIENEHIVVGARHAASDGRSQKNGKNIGIIPIE